MATRILIVEDEQKLLDILTRSLKAEGYLVDGVRTAAEGLEYSKTYPYDLLILDLQLPDGTGTGLLRRLREAHEKAQAPIAARECVSRK